MNFKDPVANVYAAIMESTYGAMQPVTSEQEEDTQNTLFGANDYAPFNEPEHLDLVNEAVEQHPTQKKRLIFMADPGVKSATKGIVVPKHMWEGNADTEGMSTRNEARAAVYGSGHREPLSLGKITEIHKRVLDDHFSKPKTEQIKIEKAALGRLIEAKHITKGSDTLDTGEKTDTVQHEFDEHGRSFQAAAAKGVAGHALYTSGSGQDQKHHVLNTCPGQTEGCGGGVDHRGIADTSKGTCFAPKAEAQYVNASTRRACHEQAKHDPAMTSDWILAHTHSLRKAADKADKVNQRFLFRPNVVDETDTTSRIAIKHLNTQRAGEGKPPIVGNSYGKTSELHDPANHWYVTYSNTGPKVKQGGEIPENKKRDSSRIHETILATTPDGDHKVNDDGHQTPPKNSYAVLSIKRDGALDKEFQKHVTHVKYWSAGKEVGKLSDAEKAQGVEGHYDGEGKPTTPEKAHYGHTTIKGDDGIDRRYDYQKQHVLHPRLVNVNGHMIPTDSRFMDNNFLPKKRFKSKNGKDAGAILITTPTHSTSNDQHLSNFTHHVDAATIETVKKNKGELEIDRPADQEEARGKNYVAPVSVPMPKSKKKK